MYTYSEYNEFNRFSNLDSVEGKIINHLLYSESKYADFFWKILKYDDANALNKPSLTLKEKKALIEGGASSAEENQVRLFLSPFVDDAWTLQASSVYIYIEHIYPSTSTEAEVSVAVETVIHSKINALISDADLLNHPDTTNPNDFYGDNTERPAFDFKSRATVLLKCILAELNGLYVDGIGYLVFVNKKPLEGDKSSSNVAMNLFNRRSFFGHSIKFNTTMSGVSESGDVGF